MNISRSGAAGFVVLVAIYFGVASHLLEVAKDSDSEESLSFSNELDRIDFTDLCRVLRDGNRNVRPKLMQICERNDNYDCEEVIREHCAALK